MQTQSEDTTLFPQSNLRLKMLQHDLMVDVVLPAAGSSTRMGVAASQTSKQFQKVLGIHLIAYTVHCFHSIPWIRNIVIVVSPSKEDYVLDLGKIYSWSKVRVCFGGLSRHRSIWNGLRSLQNDCKDSSLVLIHDGARPFVSESMIEKVVEAARKHGAAGVVRPLVSTVIKPDATGLLESSLTRTDFRNSEMPQAFQFGLISQAYQQCSEEDLDHGTECLLLALRYSQCKASLVEGGPELWKVTYARDLLTMESVVKERLLTISISSRTPSVGRDQMELLKTALMHRNLKVCASETDSANTLICFISTQCLSSSHHLPYLKQAVSAYRKLSLLEQRLGLHLILVFVSPGCCAKEVNLSTTFSSSSSSSSSVNHSNPASPVSMVKAQKGSNSESHCLALNLLPSKENNPNPVQSQCPHYLKQQKQQKLQERPHHLLQQPSQPQHLLHDQHYHPAPHQQIQRQQEHCFYNQDQDRHHQEKTSLLQPDLSSQVITDQSNDQLYDRDDCISALAPSFHSRYSQQIPDSPTSFHCDRTIDSSSRKLIKPPCQDLQDMKPFNQQVTESHINCKESNNNANNRNFDDQQCYHPCAFSPSSPPLESQCQQQQQQQHLNTQQPKQTQKDQSKLPPLNQYSQESNEHSKQLLQQQQEHGYVLDPAGGLTIERHVDKQQHADFPRLNGSEKIKTESIAKMCRRYMKDVRLTIEQNLPVKPCITSIVWEEEETDIEERLVELLWNRSRVLDGQVLLLGGDDV